jgi:hypothetical protein
LKEKQPTPTKPKSKTVWLVLSAVVLLGGIAWFAMRSTEATPKEDAQVQMPSPEKLTTLSPSMFVGRTREAYQTAMDIPEVLQQIQCYCGCKESAGHQNNLYCFTDQHGAT